MDRITAVATSATGSIVYMDGNVVNDGGVPRLTSADSLVVKSTRFVLDMDPETGASLTIHRSVSLGLRAVMNM
jgi:hypothetical protein